jgi:hypothetical protein
MSLRLQILLLAALVIVVVLAWLFPRPTGAEVPAGRSMLSPSEFRALPPPSANLNVEVQAGSQSARPVPPSPSPAASAPATVPSRSASSVPPATPVHPDTKATSDASAPGPRLIRVASATGLSGVASWFASPIGVSAAGPALRAALGANWRGRQVSVCAGPRCVSTILGDWMRADRLIDLDVNVFPAVCGPLSLGLCEVKVTP